jgi:hypothetical protein
MKNKLKFATLTLGTVLALAAPAVAAPRDRNDFVRDDHRVTISFRTREIERQREIERLRLERERLARLQNRNRFDNHRTYSNGYSDNANHWHPYR